MQCPRCQAQNRAGAQFCRECGTRLEAVCPACGPVTGVRVWKPGAGKQLAGFMIGKYGTYYYVCPNLRCGMRVEPVTAPMAPGVDWNAPTTFVRDGHPNRREFTPYVPNTRRRRTLGS